MEAEYRGEEQMEFSDPQRSGLHVFVRGNELLLLERAVLPSVQQKKTQNDVKMEPDGCSGVDE